MADDGYNQVLRVYYENLTEYKLTGNSAFKTAADTAQAWLDQYVKAQTAHTDKMAADINAFVAQYQDTNPDLIDIQKRIQKVRKEGPELQNIYDTEKEAQAEEAVDYSVYYTKVGLIAGVGAILAIVSFF